MDVAQPEAVLPKLLRHATPRLRRELYDVNISLTLTQHPTIWSGNYFYPHFPDEENEVWEGS